MNNAMIGSDPEMFIKGDNGVWHAIGMIGGSKSSPLIVDGGALQEDNVLLEFNTDPTDNIDTFVSNIRKVMDNASRRMMIQGYQLVENLSSYIYRPEVISQFPDIAFEFGCTPDFNALTGEQNPTPTSVDPNLRTAGGHIHIGWSHLGPVDKATQDRVGIMCDYFLGLPSLAMDNDDKRRELYGKACAVRYKPYGVEYRTLSNFWIWDDKNVRWAFDQAQRAYNAAISYGDALMATVPPQDVQAVINSNDRAVAKAMLEALDHAS